MKRIPTGAVKAPYCTGPLPIPNFYIKQFTRQRRKLIHLFPHSTTTVTAQSFFRVFFRCLLLDAKKKLRLEQFCVVSRLSRFSSRSAAIAIGLKNIVEQ